MWRILTAFSLLCVTAIAWAATDAGVPLDIPSFFKPVPDDLSIWFLGNIFGSDLIQGSRISDIKLLSRVFGMFNQVVLVVGMIIVTYTVVAGSLNTASEGKALGEKWNSVWMPVRTSLGIAMLVPKGGSGYCMAQYLVMWLTIQGVGAADTVWGTMLSYFEQGGAIYSGTSGNSGSYLNADSVDPVYAWGAHVVPDECQSCATNAVNLLSNVTCVENFNQDPATQALTGIKQYEIYAPDTSDRPDLIFFGNRAAMDPKNLPAGTSSDPVPGAECGYVIMAKSTKYEPSDEDAAKQIYGMAMYNFTKTLQEAGKVIIGESKGEAGTDDQYSRSYDDIQHGVQLFVSYIAGYNTILNPPADSARTKAIDQLRKYGWILAGNYYTILSAYKENQAAVQGEYVAPTIAGYQAPLDSADAPYAQALADYQQYFENWGNDDSDTPAGNEDLSGLGSALAGFLSNFHDMAGFAKTGGSASVTGASGKNKKNFIGIVDTEQLLKGITSKSKEGTKVTKKGKEKKDKQKSSKDKSSKAVTVKTTDKFMKMMTGESTSGREVAKDPIIRASEHGKTLTDAAIGLMGTFMVGTIAVTAMVSSMSWASPGAWIANAWNSMILPPVLALAAFMYMGGAMLGIFLPLIPPISFLTAAIGWLMQSIESIAAAPLVAVGLIMPESKDEIWGRAAPAYMLTLNLFLRPPLMIIGFGAAMILTWILVSMLNITFLVLLNVSFKIEGAFGYVTILMVYSGLLLYMVTEAYSLVVMVPNKVLHWIGDQSMGVKGAEQALSGAKADTEKGAGAVGAGAGHAVEGRKEAAESGGKAKESKEKAELKAAEAKKSGPPAADKSKETGGEA